MPAAGAIADQDVDKLHGSVFELTNRELKRVTGAENPPAPLVEKMKGFTRAVLELKAAKDVPDPRNLREEARRNIAGKQRAADTAYDAMAQEARGVSESAVHQVGQVIKFYAREIDRGAGSVMENTGRFY